MSKLLSIAMPSYNVAQYLRQGLDSLCDARLASDVEVLVVNDGSLDDTAVIAQEYVERMPELFRLINKENGGHGSAVNAGIAQASGTFFRVVDGDDWVNAEGLLKVLDALRSTDADIVVDERCDVDMTSRAETLRTLPQALQAGDSLSFDEICDNPVCEDYFTIHTMNIRTSLLRERQVRLHEGIFYVDLQYCVLATAFADKVQFVEEQVYYYLLGNANQSVSYANYAKRYAHHEAMTKDVVAFVAECQQSPEFSPKRLSYLENRAMCAINTNYNIALIYEKDRGRGAQEAKAFKAWLHERYPQFDALTDARYKKAKLLHALGVDGPRLDRLMGR